MLEIVGYASMAFMGLILGLMGAGGSILAVPILIYLFKLSPTAATFYSLFIVGSSALFGTLTYARNKSILFKEAVLFFFPSLVGVLIARRIFLPLLPESNTKNLIILASFTFVLLAASLTMLFKKENAQKINHPQFLKTIFSGFFIGIVTGFVGVGGGFLIVPALTGGLGFAMNMAVGTSLMIISLNSLVGFFSDLLAGQIPDWYFIFKLLFFSALGIFLGTKLNKKIPAKNLKKLFGWFVLTIGCLMFLQQALKLFTS